MSIEAMKQALEALERSVATCFDQYAHQQAMSQPDHFINQAITSLRQAIADFEKHEVSQEPVAWQWRRKDKAWSLDNTFNSEVYPTTLDSEVRPLYTHPQPKREWVGLTDEDIKEAYKQAEKKEPYMGAVTRKGIAEAFEQILKEKNT